MYFFIDEFSLFRCFFTRSWMKRVVSISLIAAATRELIYCISSWTQSGVREGHLSLVLLRSLGVWDRALSVQDLWAMRTGMHFTFFRFRPLPFPSLEHPDYILTITVSTPLSVRGITCKLCIPDEKTFKVCDKASEQVEVDCDVQPPPENLTQLWENRTYDACYTAQIEALALGKTFNTFVFGCGVKVNQSDNL